MKISIITATYNRAYCLPNIYNSLLRNSHRQDFEWILVDDGSIDDTEQLARKWQTENKINFRYYKKENEGKTRAVKLGFDKEPRGEYTLILDSDDYLSDNAIEIIINNVSCLGPKFIGILGLKAFTNGEIVGQKFYSEESNYIDLYFGKKSISSDKLFIIKTDIYKNSYEQPFEGEKFLPDNIPYINANIYGGYKLINEIFYYGDYLTDGMTNNVFRMAMNNINGYIYEKKRLQTEKLTLKFRILNTIKYINYSILGKRNIAKIICYSGDKLLTILLYFPVLLGLYRYRKLKLSSIIK